MEIDRNGPEVVCIDDFATKKRYNYGTVMVNARTGQIVDMLESRESEAVSQWLASFPNIKIVSRDGSQLYAKAIRTAHPGAMQVSDRFHIFKGLTDAARQFMIHLMPQRIPIAPDAPAGSYWQKEARADLPERLHNASTQKRAASVQKVRELWDEGLNLTQISKVTGHCHTTVKKYLSRDFDPAFSSYGVSLPSKLKPYCDTIHAMLDEHKKFREIEETIRNMGYRGSDSTIRMYTTRKRRLGQAAMQKQVQGAQLIERKYLVKLLYNPIDKIKGITVQQLDKILAAYPQLITLYDLIRDFKAIFAAHHVDDLDQWMKAAKALGIPDIDSFVNGLSRDIDAVRNAVLYEYNNGRAEGCVNKIKRIKHSMYGKASFQSLRAKVLLEQKWRAFN